MSEQRCYTDCKIIKELKSLCLEKEQEIANLQNKIYSLKNEIKELKSKTIHDQEIVKEQPKQNKPPKVIGL